MQLETIKLSELEPSPYNPRRMEESQYQKLQKSMETYGLVDPIIINLKNNHIIGGHQRYTVLREKSGNDVDYTDPTLQLLRLGDVGWVFQETDITIKDENDEKGMNLSLNRLDGEFDENKLNDLFSELMAADYDMDLTGFEDYEVIEYTMDDYDLELFKDDTNSENDKEGADSEGDFGLNFTEESDEDIHMYNIHFNTHKQRKQFTDWIAKLKQENKDNPDKTITQLIIEYLENNIQTIEEKVPKYSLLLESKEEKEKLTRLMKDLQENKNYQANPLMELIR